MHCVGGSHEVGRGHARGHGPGIVWYSTEQLWLILPCSGEVKDGGNVPTTVAVVGCRPHGDQLVVKHELDALMDQLVCPADQGQVVQVHKLDRQGDKRERGGGRWTKM